MDAGGVPLNAPQVPPRLPSRLLIALAVVPAAFLAVFYAWPLATLVGQVVNGTTLSLTIHRAGLADIIWFTFAQALASTVVTLVVGLLPAWLLARWTFPGRRLLSAVVTVPFLMPTVVVGAAFLALLPDRLHGTASAIVIAHVFFNIAVVVRVVGAVWSQLPDDLTGAARTLGAGRWRAFREVTLPVLTPAIMAAASIIFLFTFTSFGVVQVLGGPANPTLEVEIARRATQLGDVGGAALLAVIQLVALGVLVSWSAWSQRRATISLGLAPSSRRRAATPGQRWTVAFASVGTALFVLTPLAALALQSIRPGDHWSMQAWRTLDTASTRPGPSLGVDPLDALTTSLRYMVEATAVSVLLGGLASLAIAAGGRRGQLLDVGLMLPLGTSAVTIGLGMLITFDRAPVDWRAQPWLVPLGHALVATPFVVRATLPVLRSRPVEWIDAAATLGASPIRAWWHVDVAMLRRPLIIGAGFAAAISLGEFGATTFLSRTGRETLPIVIARLLGRTGDIPRAQAFAMATILAILTVLVIVGVESLQRDATHDR